VKKYSIFIQCMIDYWYVWWYNLLLTPSSCPIHSRLFTFFISCTIEVFFYKHNIYSQDFLFTGNIFFLGYFLVLWNSRTLPGLEHEFVIFQVFHDAWGPAGIRANNTINSDIKDQIYFAFQCWPLMATPCLMAHSIF